MLCCSNCFTDTEIKPMIDGKKDDDNCNIKNRETGDCDFCGKKGVYVYDTTKGGPIEDNFNGLLDIYTPASLLPSNFPKDKIGLIKNILHDKWPIFNLTADKIYDLVTAICAKKYKSHPELFDEPVGVLQFKDDTYLDENSILKNLHWDDFVKDIKTKNRFHSSCISIDKLATFLEYAVSEYAAGEVFYRSRICSDEQGYSPYDMGEPPNHKAKGGRVNPIGIGVLYLSDSMKTTLYEIRAGKYDYVTVGRFKLKSNIKVIDLEKIDKISPFINTIDYTQYAINIEHLKKIAEEISKPVRNNNELDYIPTQYISDYIKSQGYDGIEYASVMRGKGKNLAVFDSGKLECCGTRVYDIKNISYSYSLV